MDESKEESEILYENSSPDNVMERTDGFNKEDSQTELLNNEVEADDSSGSGEVSESEPETRTDDFTRLDKKFEASNYGTVDEGDDRSQTPLQDEIENAQGVESENVVTKSPNVAEDVNDDIPSSIIKDATLNDDHGELDYEEDEMLEEGHDKGKNDLYLPSDKKSEDTKPESKGSDALSSDGELADDDDWEEGEIKEQGTKRPFIRPLCRFFTRGNCTWGINCRFLHPGVNDKGNYSLIDQQHAFQPIPPPGMVPMLRGPPPSWVQERLGKRMLPPPRPSEISQSETEGGPTNPSAGDGPVSESAWERGLRHAKEIQRKRKDTDNDDKKDKDDSLSPLDSPPNAIPAQLAPPPPRDPYFDDLHRPLPPPMPGRMHPPPMPLHPPLHHHPDNWSYRHPFEYEMRWHRPPPPEFMHHGFPPIHDMRFMDRERLPTGRRFSPPLRMDPGRKDDRMSRYDRYRGNEGLNFDASREKCEEWKDPWLRTKSPKKKNDSSSSRSRSGKRSKRSYSSFSSSSYSTKTRSSSSSSYSSSRSSFSSRSRSSSKSSNSIPKTSVSKKMSPYEKFPKPSESLQKNVNTKVIPPSLADMSNAAKLLPAAQASPPATSHPTKISHPTTSGENLKPPMSSLSITIAGKQTGNIGKTNQLQPVGKAVAEAFKDVDDDTENMKARARTVKLPQSEFNKSEVTASGIVYKSGIIQGNVSYPMPVKINSEIQKKNAVPQAENPAKRTRSPSTSRSKSSSSHSHSSSSHNGDSDHIYSDIASPISSESPISPPKLHHDRIRGNPQKGQEQLMHRTERDRQEVKSNKYLEAKSDRREMHAVSGDSKIRRDFRSEYASRPEMKPDQKPRKLPRPDAYPDLRGDGREQFKGDARRAEQRMDAPRGSNMRIDHSRERGRATIHPHIRREESYNRGRSPPDSSIEYRRVVHSGPPKTDVRHQAPTKRPSSPYSQKSPKRMRQISSDHKEPVKIPIPKSERTNSGRGNTRVSKDGFEEDARPSSHQLATGKPKVVSKKTTSTKREELLLQLKAVEDAIAKKRFKNQ